MREGAGGQVADEPEQVVSEAGLGRERPEGGLFAAERERQQGANVDPPLFDCLPNQPGGFAAAALGEGANQVGHRRREQFDRKLDRFASQRRDPGGQFGRQIAWRQ